MKSRYNLQKNKNFLCNMLKKKLYIEKKSEK